MIVTMNERLLTGLRLEQSGQNKIGVVRLEDILGGQKLTFGLCELSGTCDDEENTLDFGSYLKGGDVHG